MIHLTGVLRSVDLFLEHAVRKEEASQSSYTFIYLFFAAGLILQFYQ